MLNKLREKMEKGEQTIGTFVSASNEAFVECLGYTGLDYVIIDSSPVTVSADAEMWMGLSDTALLVVRQDWADVRIINDAVDMIWTNTGDFTGFVLNAFEPEWGSAGRSQHYGYESYA